MWPIADSPFLERLRSATANDSGEMTATAASWEEATASLAALADLEDDWDGQGAEAPAGDVIESAVDFAAAIRDVGILPPGRIVPGVNGTVILEWQPGSGIYAEAEIAEPGLAEFIWKVPGEPIRFWEIRAAVAV